MDGRALAERIRGEVADEVARLGALGLATVLVGDDPASDIYIRNKHTAAREVGDRRPRLPAAGGRRRRTTCSACVAELNAEDEIDGILVQLPLPPQSTRTRVIRAVDPVKDVDGFHPFNAGQLYLGDPTHVPATPLGIMALLDEYDVELEGASAVVIGRSADRRQADRPPAAAGERHRDRLPLAHGRPRRPRRARRTCSSSRPAGAGLVGGGHVKPGAAVVDVGLNRTDDGARRRRRPCRGRTGRALITPVPGGVGPMTIAMLLRSTVRAACTAADLLAFPEV